MTKFWPLNVIGRCGRTSWSFPAAIRLPESVSEPRMTSIASTAIMNGGTSGTCRWYSAMPTSVTQKAPNAWLKAVRCGTAVICTRPSGTPMIVPRTSADGDPLVIDDLVVEQGPDDRQQHAELAGADAVAGPCSASSSISARG